MKAIVIGALALLFGSAAVAQETDILKKAINVPSVSFNVYGPTQTNRIVRDKGVVGGQALRVVVASKGPENYTVGANAPLSKPILKGHRIILSFWARAPKLQGEATAPIAFVGIVGGPPAYTPVIGGSVDVDATWKLHTVKGVAPGDFAVGAASIALHLSAAAATIDLGPIFVIDLDAAG